jgi:hypothetical protein
LDQKLKPFSVVRSADQWTVIGLGRKWGRYAFKVDAEEAALRLALRTEADGEPAEVLVQEPWGEIRRL